MAEIDPMAFAPLKQGQPIPVSKVLLLLFLQLHNETKAGHSCFDPMDPVGLIFAVREP